MRIRMCIWIFSSCNALFLAFHQTICLLRNPTKKQRFSFLSRKANAPSPQIIPNTHHTPRKSLFKAPPGGVISI